MGVDEKEDEMTAGAISKDARWGEIFAVTMPLGPFAEQMERQLRFPVSVANCAAFTVKLDLKRLDIGLAAAMGKHRGL